MKILIDADACPVTRIAADAAKKHSIKVVIICDTNHALNIEGAELHIVDKGADSADIALVNLCEKDDIVITQDYGVAAMALSRGARAIHQSGHIYTADNIDSLLAQRHISAEARRSTAKNHFKGPKKRTKADNDAFLDAFEKMLKS